MFHSWLVTNAQSTAVRVCAICGTAEYLRASGWEPTAAAAVPVEKCWNQRLENTVNMGIMQAQAGSITRQQLMGNIVPAGVVDPGVPN